ncbi:MAG: hypothetical protein IH794_12560, partial [Acidobacteria bacterium]|nr:hypothetical protein [Acidobacteriota bacterium]
LIYGMSAFGLAIQLKISRSEAQKYVDRYFDKYPGVRKYMDDTRALADEKGYVETLFGRRLYLPDIHAGNAMIRKAAQRTAINAPRAARVPGERIPPKVNFLFIRFLRIISTARGAALKKSLVCGNGPM